MLTRRVVAPVALACLLVLWGGWVPASAQGLTRQYEYELDITPGLDGSAEIIVNASIPALVALHGFDLPIDSRARLDRNDVRRVFQSPYTEVTRVSRPWRRRARRFIQVRMTVRDIGELSRSQPFSWVTFRLARSGETAAITGTVSGVRREPIPEANWDGSELVAFKLHLPSRIFHHNVRDLETNQAGSVERGNIVRWEQRLSDRLNGVPIQMEVRMDNRSILYRTLWLFAAAFVAAMALLASLIWWTIRRGRQKRALADPVRPPV